MLTFLRHVFYEFIGRGLLWHVSWLSCAAACGRTYFCACLSVLCAGPGIFLCCRLTGTSITLCATGVAASPLPLLDPMVLLRLVGTLRYPHLPSPCRLTFLGTERISRRFGRRDGRYGMRTVYRGFGVLDSRAACFWRAINRVHGLSVDRSLFRFPIVVIILSPESYSPRACWSWGEHNSPLALGP